MFFELVKQWGTFLVAKLCFTSAEDPAILEQKIQELAAANPIFIDGFDMTKTNSLQSVRMISKSMEIMISQFDSHPLFPRLFSEMIVTMDAVFSSSISQLAKRSNEKALHTDKIVSAETLSEMEKECMGVFDYLSSLLDSAAKSEIVDLNAIQLDTVSLIFNYVEHYLPNAVRKSAGNILASLSSSPKHAEMICEMFWDKFALLKRDKDFRNFSTWIDGIMDIQLSLETPELMRASVSFLSAFINRARKIERGVLRMKFLACLRNIIKRISQCESLLEYSEVVQKMDEIFQLVTKWCDKKKHVNFCMEFLGRMLVESYPAFFLKHEAQFFEFLYKTIRNEKGPVPLLNVVVTTFKDIPDRYYREDVVRFKNNLEGQLLPLLFKISGKVKKPRFDTYEQNQVVVEILFQLGLKQLAPIVEFICGVFRDSNEEESAKTRTTCLGVLAELTRVIPEQICQYNDELAPYLERMLLRTTRNKNEIDLAVFTFPVIHPRDETTLAHIAQILFDLAVGEDPKIGSSCFHSVTRFIEQIVTFKRNTLLPLTFMNSLLNLLPTLPREVISAKLTYIYTLLNSIGIAIERELGNLEEIHNGESALTPQDWGDFRDNLDRTMLVLLFHPHKEIVKAAHDIESLCLSDAIQAIDRSCRPDFVCLARAIAEANDDDMAAVVRYLQAVNTTCVKGFFLATVDMWLANRGRFDGVYTGKILHLLGSMASPEYTVSLLLVELFKLLRKDPYDPDALQCIAAMTPRLWMTVINELNGWMATVGLSFDSFWTQVTGIYHIMSTNPEFKDMLAEERKLVEAFERYIANFWKSPHDYGGKDGYLTCENGLNSLMLYVRYAPDHFARIIENPVSAFEKFLGAFQGLICYHESSLFTPTFIETYLVCMTTVFEFANIEDYALFSSFLKWLAELDEFFVSKERSHLLMIDLLTMILSKNQSLVSLYSQCCFTTNFSFRAKILVAMEKVYKMEGGFEGEIFLLAPALVHLVCAHAPTRQAAYSVMCLLLTKAKTIFTCTEKTESVIPLTCHTPAGYLVQADQFLEFVARSLERANVIELFRIISDSFDGLDIPQAWMLSPLNSLLDVVVEGSEVLQPAELLMSFSRKVKMEEIRTLKEVKQMWDHYLGLISADNISELLEFVMNRCTGSSSQFRDKIVGVRIFGFIFFKYPEVTIEYLAPILFSVEREFPTDTDSFLKYLEKADVDFAVKEREVIAYNAISHIFLVNEDKSVFDKCFYEKLPQLVFYGVLMFDNDQFVLGPFPPLLESILDASLLKFARNEDEFSSNLEALQSIGVLSRASSLHHEFQINRDTARNILAYDHRVIVTVTNLMTRVVDTFRTKFFNILLSTAFSVKSCAKEVEPFLMLMALNKEITTEGMYRILLFAVFAFTHDRRVLLDSLVAVVRQRLLSETITSGEFQTEVVPAVIVFLLYLAVDWKRSLSMQMIRVLGELCDKICSLNERTSISSDLMGFLSQYGGGKYVSSLFVRFLSDSTSFGDPSVVDITKALHSFACVEAESSGSVYNWCLLLAVLTDGVRYFTGLYSSRAIEPILRLESLEWANTDSFAKFLAENFGDVSQQKFVLSFLGSFLRQFKSSDTGNSTAVMKILGSFLKLTALDIDSDVLTLSLLTSFTDDESCVTASAEVIAKFIMSRNLNDKILLVETLKPQFKQVILRPLGYTRTVHQTRADLASFPEFQLFEAMNVPTEKVVDSLCHYISSKLV